MGKSVRSAANSLSEEIRDRIILSLQSGYMDEFLRSKQEELSVDDYIEIITSAPEPIRSKLWLLERLKSENITQDERATVSGCISAANEAMKMLEEFDKEKSCLQLNLFAVDCCFMLAPYIYEAVPVIDFKYARRYIGQKLWSLDEEDTEDSYLRDHDYYYKLFLYSIDEMGETKKQMSYILDEGGDLQYINVESQYTESDCLTEDEQRFCDFIRYFSCAGNKHRLDKWIPFKVGDMLYVDCRPYRPPVYCLMCDTEFHELHMSFDDYIFDTEFQMDLCLLSEETAKKGWYLPNGQSFDTECSMPAFFCVEIYDEKSDERELPNEYKLMADISRLLKKDPSLAEKLGLLCEDFWDKHLMVLTGLLVPADNGCVYGLTKKKLIDLIEKAKAM